MAQQFDCPNCGAPIEYAGDQDMMVCPFCNSRVNVPAEYVQKVAQTKLSKQAKTIMTVVLVIILAGTCIGFGGTILGVLGGLLGALVGIIAPFLGH